jgi:hypothetical protein
MRTQEELKEYYQKTDPFYHGENPPEGWRFVDPSSEVIKEKRNLMTFENRVWFKASELETPSNLPRWAWITNLPLPESAHENAAKNSTKTNMKYNVKFGHVIYQGVSAASLAGVFNNGVSYELSEIVDCLDLFDYHPASIGVFDLEIVPVYSYFAITTKDGKTPSFRTHSEIANFVYRKNRDEVTKRRIGITEEDSHYIKGIDLDDNNHFKQFLKEKIVGGWIVREKV